MKKLVVILCLTLSDVCAAQSPGARVLVLENDQGEKRLSRNSRQNFG